MKPGFIGMVLIALLANGLCYAQNNTPMEVLVNIANENERFIPYKIFKADDRESTYLNDYLKSYSTIKLNQELLDRIVTEGTPSVSIEIPMPGDGVLELKLINHDIRAEGFSIVDKATLEVYDTPEAQFYRGIFKRGKDAQAGMSFFRDEVYGLFSGINKGNIVLAKDPINPGDGSNYIVYYEKDLLIERNMECGSDYFDSGKFYSPSTDRNTVYSTCEDIEQYIEATRDLYVAKGYSTSALTNYITAFFNNVSIIFRNESIYTSIKRITINTTADGYSGLASSFDKLSKFGEDNQNNYQQYGAELAHLVDVTTPNIGGIAWINALCSNYKYYPAGNATPEYHYGAYAYSSILTEQSDFPDYSLTVFMFSHEMGHNLGSRHTQWCNWPGGPIDNCVETEGTCAPGPPPASDGGTIMSYCHLTSYGINYSYGFGPLPGDEIRSKTAAKTCTERYIPTATVEATPSQNIFANRECTDEDGWTHYYFDNNTSDEVDDELILSVLKENENIGSLDDGTLTVQLKTSTNAGIESTHIDNPGYSVSPDWHVMNRWFELNPTNEPINPVTVRFYYTSRDFMDVMANQETIEYHTDLIFYKVDSPSNPNPDYGHVDVSNEDISFYLNGNEASLDTWKYLANGDNHIAEFKVSSFSGGGGGFSENGQLILPVELKHFEANLEDEHVALEWETYSEINNDFFMVERSSDGIDFEAIGRIDGHGTTSDLKTYSFLDRSAPDGLIYYRLSQTDFDGSKEYIGIRSVRKLADHSFNVFPNPSKEGFFSIVSTKDIDAAIKIELRSLSGKIIYQVEREGLSRGDQERIDNTSFPDGIYLLQISQGAYSTVQKLIKN